MKIRNVVLALLLIAPACAANEDGHHKLWRNQSSEAKIEFRSALKANPNDVLALRGLGWAALAEDDSKGALLAWRPLFRLASAQPHTAALWPTFVNLAVESGRHDLLEGAARDIVAGKSPTPELRAGARLVLADAARRAGKSKEAQKLLDEMSFVRAWRVIGPFDNVSRSGFAKVFAPEREADVTKVYKGKDDQPVRWRTLPLVARDGTCALGRYLGGDSPGVFYVTTAVFSPQAQNVWLRFNPTGAAKIWLNGALILSDDTYRRRQLYVADPIRVPVALKVGWNALLVKVADSDTTDGAFALRFTTTRGADLALRSDAAQYKFAAPGGSAPPPHFPLISALRGPKVYEPENAALLASLQRLVGEPAAAIRTLNGALAQVPDPKSGWLYWELAQALDEDGQEDEARAAQARAITLNPRLITARLAAIESEESLTAGARVQKLNALLPISRQSASVTWALAKASHEAGLKAEALAAARRAAQHAPGADNLASLVSWLDDAGRKYEAEKKLGRALKTFPQSETLLRAKAERLAGQGRFKEAITAYRQLLTLDIPQPGYLLSIADLQEKMRDVKGAVATLKSVRTLRPQSAVLAARLGNLLHINGDKTGALALYREAISLNPAQISLREKVQLLLGAKPVLDLVPGTNVAPLLSKTPTAREAGAPAIMLLDEARQVVYPDRATVTRYRQIIKVFDAAAVQRYQRFPLSGPTASASVTVESARIISANGKARNVTQDTGDVEVPLPSLAPGEIIDVTYRVEDYQKGGLARQFWTQWMFNIAGTPVKVSRFVLITPPDVTFNVRSHGEIVRPQTRDVREAGGQTWRVREWRMDNLAPRPVETLMPAAVDEALWLDISSIASWKQIVDWYRNLAAPHCVPDAAIRAKALEITRNARSENEKLHAIYHYVTHSLQYQSTPFRLSGYVPAEGKQVIRERYADCKDKAALLTALCEAVGIKSRMVLLSRRSAGITPPLPSPRFNHAIAVVDTADGPLWIDATADLMSFGALPVEDQGVPALIIDDSTADLTTTPVAPAENNLIADTHVGQLGADGKLSGSVELSATGDWGWAIRQTFQQLPQNRRDEAFAKMTASLVKNARSLGGTLSGLDDPDRPMQIKVNCEADKFGAPSGNLLLTRLPWAGNESSTPELWNAPNRTQAIEAAQYRGLYLGTVRLQIPDGFTPQELPGEVKDETPWGRYRFGYKIENNTLLATREVLFTALRIEAKDAVAYADFLKAIRSETQRQIVLKK